MQLFILDHTPEKAAVMLCDIHLRKMCLETAQILSSVLFNGGRVPHYPLPRQYNPRHPVIAAINTPAKINWVLIYNRALHKEYRKRFGKAHAYSPLVRKYFQELFRPGIKICPEKLDFARAFKDEIIPVEDLVSAYREYYRRKKRHLRHWHYTNADEPEWLK